MQQESDDVEWTAESAISGWVRAVLCETPVGSSVPESKPYWELLRHLEWYLPALLREARADWKREWKHESLDGVIPARMLRIGPEEVELFGQCILISDQTLTPLQLKMQLETFADEIAWLECRLGERGPDGMIRIPYRSHRPRLHWPTPDDFDWMYVFGFGERRA